MSLKLDLGTIKVASKSATKKTQPLSAFIWKNGLNKNEAGEILEPKIKWEILKECTLYSTGMKNCDLCTTEQLFILKKSEKYIKTLTIDRIWAINVSIETGTCLRTGLDAIKVGGAWQYTLPAYLTSKLCLWRHSKHNANKNNNCVCAEDSLDLHGLRWKALILWVLHSDQLIYMIPNACVLLLIGPPMIITVLK